MIKCEGSCKDCPVKDICLNKPKSKNKRLNRRLLEVKNENTRCGDAENIQT